MIIDKTRKNKLTAVHSFTVFPQDLNYADSLFGGKVMAEMDIAGVKVVRRALYGTGADGCVTASVDRIDFKKPAFLGDLITMVAEIKAIGKSSLQVRITVTRESIMGDKKFIAWLKKYKIGSRIEVKDYRATELMQQYSNYPKWVASIQK